MPEPKFKVNKIIKMCFLSYPRSMDILCLFLFALLFFFCFVFPSISYVTFMRMNDMCLAPMLVEISFK